MTVEIVEFIDSLDRTNPKGSDPISEGDDHVRNIKAAIVDTFPNITGEVTASHDELNQLVGLGEIVDGALPDQPTEESSLLHNVGDKWKETTTIKITGDKAFIPAFAGLGNVNLYVNNDGEIVASEQSTDPTWLHGMNDHTDVDFQGAPAEDDIMIHDGTAWRAKRNQSGNTMTPISQPKTCGQFSATATVQEWKTDVSQGSGTRTFDVPAGMKFFLKDISVVGNDSGGQTSFFDRITISHDSILMDGFNALTSFAGSLSNNGQAASMFGPSNDPMYQIKSSLVMGYSVTSNVNSGSGDIIVSGYFVEDK